jgi:predicted Zn-dependent protease
MIRVATFDEYEPAVLKQLCKVLYQAFAVGTEHVGMVQLPSGFAEPFHARELLTKAPAVQAYQDDKVLYLTARKLGPRKAANIELPTLGVSEYGGQRALLSTAHIKNVNDNVPLLARFALQEIGHAWGVHHCLDHRCAMYPPWTPSFLEGDATFCTFCREASEQKIRLAKS